VTFNFFLLKLYFWFRPIHLTGRYDIIRDFRKFDTGLAVDFSLWNALYPLMDHRSFFFPALMNNCLILFDPVDRGIVRLLVNLCVGVIVPLLDCGVIFYHCVVDDRRSTVIVDDGSAVNIGHPDIPVIVHTVEIVLVDHDSMACVCIIPDVYIDPGNAEVVHDHCMTASPVTVAVVCLARRKRHPPHISSGVNP